MEFSYRECSHPEPQNGGKYCEGQRVQYQSCNTRACPEHSGEFSSSAATPDGQMILSKLRCHLVAKAGLRKGRKPS